MDYSTKHVIIRAMELRSISSMSGGDEECIQNFGHKPEGETYG
jgi:hypothetical protein